MKWPVLLMLGIVGALLLAIALNNTGSPAGTLGENLITANQRNSQTLTYSEVTAQASVDNKEQFSLYYGIKETFDAILFAHQEDTHLEHVALDTFADSLGQQYTAESTEYALSLFARYVHYKSALASVDASVDAYQPNLMLVAHRLEQQNDLRHRLFSEIEYRYLFSRDHAYDNAALQRLSIAADKVLSRSEKQRLIQENIASMPKEQAQSFADSLAIERINALSETFDGEAQYQAIAAEFGHQVAQRLRLVENTQSRWNTRVQAYQQWHQQLLNRDLPKDIIERRIGEKLAAAFSTAEQRRLQVFLENPTLISSRRDLSH